MQEFFHIVVQLEIHAVLAMETDGFSNFLCGGRETMNWRSCGVDRDNKRCGGWSESILGSGNREREVTMDYATEWREGGCCVAVDLGASSKGALECGVRGSVINGC